MGMKGQNTKSIRKKSLPNTRLPVVGVKNIKVHHAPSVIGSTYIELTSLVAPIGLSNPSPAEISAMRLKDFSNNWFLTSNLRPMWMEGISFEIVSNSTIKLLSGYESLEDEVFTIQYFNHTINGTVIADVRTPNASGTLLEGQTDFNLGEALPIKELSSQWPIQVFRGPNGTPMLRNANNAAYTGDDSIGNYQMIDRGDGYCQVIRFNIASDVGDEPVFWANHGALGERPDLSVLQRVDKIHGIMDKMREDLLEVTGYDVEDPTRYDEGVPTQSDLKAFGDTVAGILNKTVSTVFENSVRLEQNDGRVITANTEDIQYNGSGIGWSSVGDVHQYSVQKNDSVIRISTSTSWTSDAQRRIALFKNGVFYKYIGNQTTSNVSFAIGGFVSAKSEFLVGDKLSIRIQSSTAGTLLNSIDGHYLNIIETKIEQKKIKDLI